jgi:superfamily II DNA or RNA helicase
MSIVLPVEELSDKSREIINDELKLELKNKYDVGPSRYLIPYELTGDERIKLPFAFASRRLKIKRPTRSLFPTIDVEFDGDLRPEQVEVKQEAVSILNKKGSVIMSMYCGFGKTITGINMACAIGFKTLVIVNKIVLMTQWEESIKRFCPRASVQKIKPKCVKKDCDFYIINAINAEKMGDAFFADIGCVIVDEAHLIMAETVSKCLQSLSPRYLIGLTATPYRPDGLNGLLDFYFGEDKIIRELHREHIVYKVKTGFKPTIELGVTGRVNWGVVLDSQSKDPDRNDLILKIICHFKERNFLVLVKRVEQGLYLEEKLSEMGEKVTSLIGSNQTFEASSRILIGTCSKVGTGFDHPKLDTLLMAADVEEYFIQYLGRCMRTKDNVPVVFDLVDDNGILTKHYATRKKIYEKHGGVIKNFDLNTLT